MLDVVSPIGSLATRATHAANQGRCVHPSSPDKITERSDRL